MELTGSRVNNRRRYVGMGPDDRSPNLLCLGIGISPTVDGWHRLATYDPRVLYVSYPWQVELVVFSYLMRCDVMTEELHEVMRCPGRRELKAIARR